LRGGAALVDLLSHWNTTKSALQNDGSAWEQNSTDAIGPRAATQTSPPLNSRRRTYSREHQNQIRIGLQPSKKIHHARVISESISHDMTAKQLVEKLAKRLRVDKDKWRLVVYSNNEAPYDLPLDAKLENFLSTTKRRLYFFHE
jgi:hypothetical protein